ncbi:hypothetical protein AVEN_180233-1 [Araneus ventricosus]|uniref:Uncharacterized protein n=1 Tax=Araneus ventricosus TaxID=182803 RepID=A0A4Y2JU20_ARAVE|nr:hypothetical protein AVEN_180233-1 [Araneus ventricosus]
MDKVRLLPSGVQGLVPTKTALSSFTMNPSPIELNTASSVAQDNVEKNLFEVLLYIILRRGTSLKVLHWFVIFCGRADSWTSSS